MSNTSRSDIFIKNETLKEVFAESAKWQEEQQLKGKFCACGRPAVRFVKSSGKPYCTFAKNGCPINVQRLKKYSQQNFEESKLFELQKEITAGTAKCYICGNPAKHVIQIKGYKFCCATSTKKCPEWKAMNRERRKQWYKDNPEQRVWHRENCRKINNRPEVVAAKRSKMIYLHNQDEDFKNKYRKGYRGRAMDRIKSPENRLRQSLFMKNRYATDPDFRKKQGEGLRKEFNALEEQFFNFLNGLYDSVFRYNFKGENQIKGPGGHYRPDFICEKYKLAVDIDGAAWHGRKDKNGRESDNLRVVRYLSEGWHLLVVSDVELKFPNELARKIINFIRGAGLGKVLVPTYYPE